MILDAYAAWLSAVAIPFYTNNGFAVKIRDIMVDVTVTRSGMVTVSSYVGLVGLINPAEVLTTELLKHFPSYKIWPEKYSDYFEIEAEQTFPFTTVQVLHEKVLAMATMAEDGYTLGKELIGKNFCR